VSGVIGVIGDISLGVGGAVGLIAFDDVRAGRIEAGRCDDVRQARAGLRDIGRRRDVAASVIAELDVVTLGLRRAGEAGVAVILIAGGVTELVLEARRPALKVGKRRVEECPAAVFRVSSKESRARDDLERGVIEFQLLIF
jgi:hypothetical protein